MTEAPKADRPLVTQTSGRFCSSLAQMFGRDECAKPFVHASSSCILPMSAAAGRLDADAVAGLQLPGAFGVDATCAPLPDD